MNVRRLLLAGLLPSLLAAAALAPVAPAAPAPDGQALLRLASRLGGLSVRRPVPVVLDRPARVRARTAAALDRERPRARRAHDEAVLRALGVTGARGSLRGTVLAAAARSAVYDPATRRVHVGTRRPARAAVLAALVHALQDQHLGLRRVQRRARDRDAALAAAAALEGHAALVAGVGAGRVATSGGSRLGRFVALERGFVAGVGRRLAVDLRNLGGNRALLGALRRPPRTTEQVFHLDKLLEREPALPVALPARAGGLALASADTFGELDVRALLAVLRVPRLDRAASGWGGGRAGVYRGSGGEAAAVALDWDTELDAAQWGGAVAALVPAAFPPARPDDAECAATVCWRAAGRGVAFAREGTRTALVVAADPAAAAALARTIVPAAG